MARTPRPSIPSLSGEPRSRRLGVGPSGGGDRPLRAQLVVAAVVGVILIAVPLYLVRRPSGAQAPQPEASASVRVTRTPSAPAPVDAGAVAARALPVERVKLGAPQRVKCGASPTNARIEGGLCDALPAVERSLAAAIKAAADCAPKQKEEGSINFVMSLDFTKKSFDVFPGASGSWRGKQARRAAECVNRALAAPDWGATPHQYRYYWIAILATYPLASAVSVPPGTPTFE
ncbi:MAG TPA: hypothetical protein VGK73_31205 [Polyangiaceae bacterium]